LLINNDARHFVSHRLSQARLLEERGFEVRLAVPAPRNDLLFRSDADRDWFRELRKHPYALDRKSANPLAEARAIWGLRRIMREARPQIVHGVTPKGTIYGSLAARGVSGVRGIVSTVTGLGFVFSSSSAKARALRPLVARAYRSAFADPRARVIFQNPDDRELFLKMGVLRESQARLIAGSGVDVERFAFSEEAPSDRVRVLYVGRMLRDKGVGDLAEAARIAKREAPELEFCLLGDADPGNPSSVSLAQLRAWSDEGLLTWHAAVADVRPLVEKANIVCLPSLREGVPMALLEAAACGRALVATDVPGCREAVKPGETGILVPANDPRALAAALVGLARDPERRRAMGRAARERAVREFSKDVIAGQVAAVYEECLRAAGAGAEEAG
jgi:glycosyltransferase involved in cell wall biosynthesis